MKTVLLPLALVLLSTAAQAQCNPSIAGSCGANDPAVLGQQQLQDNRASQQQQLNLQNQQLQETQRSNAQRYQQQQQQMIQNR